MTIKSSLKYKMLHLVIIQAVFFALVLVGIRLINPNWVLSAAPQSAQDATIIKDFKHQYGMLSALSMQLANLHSSSLDPAFINNNKPTFNIAEFEKTSQALLKHINTLKKVSKQGQSRFNVDFSVLISFIFNYQDQIKNLKPNQLGFEERLWNNQLYFSRIQSEFFYIIEEVNRAEVTKTFIALQSAQTSLFIWGIASLMLLAISIFIALNHANKWKQQIASLLQMMYRINAGDNNFKKSTTSNDEFDYLTQVFLETTKKLPKKNTD